MAAWGYKIRVLKILSVPKSQNFSVRKSQNSNKEEKNSMTLPSSHLEAIL